jgi:hypothetical protein
MRTNSRLCGGFRWLRKKHAGKVVDLLPLISLRSYSQQATLATQLEAYLEATGHLTTQVYLDHIPSHI